MFSTLSKIDFILWVTYLTSANVLNLDQSKILLFSKMLLLYKRVNIVQERTIMIRLQILTHHQTTKF